MRVIRPATTGDRRGPIALAIAMLLVGLAAAAIMGLVPPSRAEAMAALGLSAALGLGIGTAWLVRAFRSGGANRRDEDLVRLIGPVFDDAYVLLVSPKLPGVPGELAGLLVGPPGVRALVARRWNGRYRVRGRGWEYDTHDRRRGWIPCRTNPSFDAQKVAEAVSTWANGALDPAATTITPAIAFPRSSSTIVLEEPDTEVVTTDNAPWWGSRIGRLQRMDAQRVARFVAAVIDAGDGFVPVPAPAHEKGVEG